MTIGTRVVHKRGPSPKNISGQRFGRLVAESYVGNRNWLCLCDCGNRKIVHGSNLRRATRSCGCLALEQVKALPRLPRHGHTQHRRKTPTYRSWTAMRTRCGNPNAPAYVRYGALGVTVCPRWDSFDNFLADMGDRPNKHTLDRIDPSGNYEPGNCRWADAHTQRLNRRRRT